MDRHCLSLSFRAIHREIPFHIDTTRMKLFRFGLPLAEVRDCCLCFLALIAGSLFLYSCEDGLERPAASAHISFIPEISDSWNLITRSGMASDAPRDSVTGFQGGGDTPFYLYTLYADRISSPFSDNRDDAAALTRATPVTRENMYASFGVSAYSYTGSWNERMTPDYMYDAIASNSGGTYAFSPAYYWPGAAYKMRFFAYAPRETANMCFQTGRTRALRRFMLPCRVAWRSKRIFWLPRRMSWAAITIVPSLFLSNMLLPPLSLFVAVICEVVP